MIDRNRRQLVRDRAGNRCEYCRILQVLDPLYQFHVEHIIARKHGGRDEPDNLALACYHCNQHKGTNLSAIDPQTLTVVRLFDPRQEPWDAHFILRAGIVTGLTSTGRATVRLLQFNVQSRMEIRAEGTR